MPVRYQGCDGIAVVTVDNPPVNALSPGVPAAIEEAVARGVEDPEIQAIVLTAAGGTFVAGADIRIFQTITDQESSLERSREMHARLRRLEECPKPLVAALHGTALGAGLELAMACHYRVALADTRVGQPEVTLGLIPGAGGTQRLPRLAGLALAVEMCTQGGQVGAWRALEAGLLDRVVSGDLLEAAMEYAQGHAPRRARDREIAGDGDLFERARDELRRRARGARAPFAALEAIAAGAELGFDEGSRREMELFAECLLSRESRNMVRLFFAEREAGKVIDAPAARIRSAAIVGAGTMGGGIAMAYANAGIPVLLKDESRLALDRGLGAIRRNYEASLARGKLTREQFERAMLLIRPTLQYDDFDEVDIVVEAVFEDLELKKRIFAELARATRPECLLASNTSTLDIDQMARASGRGERVAGHHFFSPANVMRLIEVVRGEATSDETVATSMALAKKLGKIAVMVGNCFGFVANRILAYYLREALLLVEEGAGAPEVDAAMTAFGFPVGPFAMQDIAGLDVGWRIRRHGKRAEGPQSPVPDWLCEMGRYGQKTGAGWYLYEPGNRAPLIDPLIEELAAKAARQRGVRRRHIAEAEIVSRLLTAMANEGARVLGEGMARGPADIDVIWVNGFGFPRHRGGPMAWADEIGPRQLLATVEEYRGRFGDYWQAAPLLERLAASGGKFYGGAVKTA